MRISEQGQRLIQGFEACSLLAYPCSARVWTIGYGHTGGVNPGDQIIVAQAEAWLMQPAPDLTTPLGAIISLSDGLC